MANELQFFDAAKAALAKAAKVDEVKKIHDKAAAIKAASKVAKDKTLQANAAEIQMRAERRVNELMELQKKTEGFNKGGGDQRSKHRDSKKPGGNAKVTLAEAGIDKNLANRARKVGKPSDEEFEGTIAAAKERVTTPPGKPKDLNKKPKPKKVGGRDVVDRCVDDVKLMVGQAVQHLRRGPAAQDNCDRLFAALQDVIDDLKAKLPPLETVEESAEKRRAVNAKLADEAIAKETESAPAQ